MIIVEGHARLGAGDIERLKDAMRTQIETTRAEPGCLHYSYAADVLDPNILRISELWTDQAAIDAHFKSAHMAAFNRALGTATIESLKVDAYTAEHSRTLLGG